MGNAAGPKWALRTVALAAAATLAVVPANAEEGGPQFKLSFELKLHVRDSRELEFQIPAWLSGSDYPGDAYLGTPSAGTSMEISTAALVVDARLTPHLRGHGRLHVVDLYSRNPTSVDQRVFLREAWVLFGDRREGWNDERGGSFHALFGKAPRFSRQEGRRLESFGLWGVGVGWLEQLQVQLGGDLGQHFYWRLHWANPNPLYMRDTNALAGDVGYEGEGDVGSGFPILYDTAAPDLSVTGEWEVGAGLGVRSVVAETNNGFDLLAWYFERDLADRLAIEGSRWPGELALLESAGLPYEGRRKEEYGGNLQARIGGLRLFGQYVEQDIAGLLRSGYEIELAYWTRIPALFASGDSPVVTWIQPAVRFSRINNGFSLVPPVELPAAISLVWDWTKLDVGVRIGIVRGVDFTLEYARHDMILLSGAKLHPDESLATLRFAY